jgi:hypothetical protein
MRGLYRISGWDKKLKVTCPNVSAPLDRKENEDPPKTERCSISTDPQPPFFDRIIVGHGLPVKYVENPNGEHYFNGRNYPFRPIASISPPLLPTGKNIKS